MKRIIASIVLVAVAAMSAGCTTNPQTGESQMSKTAKYGGIATGVGAVAGALLGGSKGALIGGGIGALAGGGYGAYSDVQEKHLREQLESQRIQVARDSQNRIQLTIPSDITFETGSADVKPSFYSALNVVAQSAAQYGSKVRIVGHTDNTGSAKLNEMLSSQRAINVGQYLAAQGVPVQNVETAGASFTQPVASNDTAAGRAQNRRVQISLY